MGKTKYMTTPDLLANAELPFVGNGHVRTAASEIVMNCWVHRSCRHLEGRTRSAGRMDRSRRASGTAGLYFL